MDEDTNDLTRLVELASAQAVTAYLELEKQRIDALIALLSADSKLAETALPSDGKRIRELAKRQRAKMQGLRVDGVTKR